MRTATRVAVFSGVTVCAIARVANAQATADAPPPPQPASVAPPNVAMTGRDDDDAVRLRDGSMVRGRIAERRPDGTLIFVLLTGETRTLPGEMIVSVGRVAGPRAAPPASNGDDTEDLTQSRPGTLPLAVTSVGPTLRVGHSTNVSGTPGTLYTPVGQAVHRDHCSTPCTLFVAPGLFRLWTGGPNIAGTTSLVDVRAGGVAVRMHAPSAATWAVSPHLLWIGPMLALAGATMIVVARVLRPPVDALLGAGIPTAAVGLGITIGGAVWLGSSAFGIESQRPYSESTSGAR